MREKPDVGKWAAWGSKELEEDCEGGATEMGHFLGGGKGAPSENCRPSP